MRQRNGISSVSAALKTLLYGVLCGCALWVSISTFVVIVVGAIPTSSSSQPMLLLLLPGHKIPNSLCYRMLRWNSLKKEICQRDRFMDRGIEQTLCRSLSVSVCVVLVHIWFSVCLSKLASPRCFGILWLFQFFFCRFRVWPRIIYGHFVGQDKLFQFSTSSSSYSPSFSSSISSISTYFQRFISFDAESLYFGSLAIFKSAIYSKSDPKKCANVFVQQSVAKVYPFKCGHWG